MIADLAISRIHGTFKGNCSGEMEAIMSVEAILDSMVDFNFPVVEYRGVSPERTSAVCDLDHSEWKSVQTSCLLEGLRGWVLTYPAGVM